MFAFRLWTIFYVFALLASAMATFGPSGILVAVFVLGFWILAWENGIPKISISGIEWILAFVVIAMLIALLLPAVESARPASLRSQCINNLKQLQIAIINYETANGKLPPPYIADANGKPMHSWRVLILPYIEENVLYKMYNFNEPWDGPNNRKLAQYIPQVFRCPGESTTATQTNADTSYFAVVGEETAWPTNTPRKLSQFKDGTSKTIMLVEASGRRVNWMEPRDFDIDEAIKLLAGSRRTGHSRVSDGFLSTTYAETSFRNVTFADGHCEWFGQLQNSALAKAFLTVSGGEKIPENGAYFDGDVEYSTVIKWGKVWSLALFVILSLLPWYWIRRYGIAISNQTHNETPTGDA